MPERMLIAYSPKKILDYVRREGTASCRDLQRNFGYDAHAARIVLLQLEMLGFLEGRGYKVERLEESSEKFSHEFYRSCGLTERGESAKDIELAERVVVFEKLPALGSYVKDSVNKALETLAGVGIKDVKEISDLPKEEFESVMEDSVNKVIESFDPLELSRLEQELESLKPKRK